MVRPWPTGPQPGALEVRVPGSSANIGPGFDSIGLALGIWDAYLVELTDAPGLEVVLEDGTGREVPQVDRWTPDRDVDGRMVGEATFEVPGDLPTGWHRLVAHLDVPAVDPATTEATLVVKIRCMLRG